jgi:hypothetical protein
LTSVPLSTLLQTPLAELLDGVVLFGSRARAVTQASQAAEEKKIARSAQAKTPAPPRGISDLRGSDTDLLLVLAPGVKLSRDLYRHWDEITARQPGSLPAHLSPHFSRLPAAPSEAGGLWLEVALEGIVLWERAPSVSSTMAQLREFIAAGGATRKVCHGAPYWIWNPAASARL